MAIQDRVRKLILYTLLVNVLTFYALAFDEPHPVATPRDFFVKIHYTWGLFRHDVCIGTIIDSHWIVTVAECGCNNYHDVRIRVEVDDFTFARASSRFLSVSRFVRHPESWGGRNKNIALLKVRYPFPAPRVLEMCKSREQSLDCSLFGVCTLMTPRSIESMSAYDEQLHEKFLLEMRSSDMPDCLEEFVCTEKSEFLQAEGRKGSPLYKMVPYTTNPECLYGIYGRGMLVFAAEYESSTEISDSLNYFSSIPYFYDWILNTIVNN